jgi:hypothetical protein
MTEGTDTQRRLEGIRFIASGPPGSTARHVHGSLIVVHPDFPPQRVTLATRLPDGNGLVR